MKKVKSVIKTITKIIICPIILWPLLVVFLQICMFDIGIGGRGDFDRTRLNIACMNVPEETTYVDILVKMERDDSNYVEFTKLPIRSARKYTDENGTGQDKYVELPITRESEIAKWNDDGYVSLTLHHKDVKELRIGEPDGKEDGRYISLNEELEVDGYFLRDFYEKYGNVRVVYVDKEGNVLKATDRSKKKYIGWDSDLLLVDGESVVFRIGEAAPWTVGLFCLLLIVIPLYTIWLIVKMIKFLCKGF